MGAIAQAAYVQVLGFPVIFWLGILTYASLAATVGAMAFGRRSPRRFKWHRYLGRITTLLATVHALFGISAYLA